MDFSTIRENWLVNWRAAKAKQRANAARNDIAAAFFWAGIAVAIESGFRDYFGTELLTFVTGGAA